MSRNRSIALVLVVLIAVGVGGYVVYDTFLRGDEVAPLALPSAGPTATETTSGTSAAATSATGPVAGGGNDVPLAGTWTVVEGSQAGYRVREQLANLPAETDAVGRTSDVSGSITLVASGDAAQLTEGSLQVDTTTIASDEGRRDNRLRSEGLQTDQFPTATFTITSPVDIPTSALDGEATDVTLTGDLTLHGVTRSVQIPTKAQLVDGQIRVAGSLPIVLADYAITPPNIGGFIVSIADQGALEFAVVFARA